MRHRLVILVNSTPKYYYLLPLHFELLYRYGCITQVPDVVLATEVPEHPICQAMKETHGVRLLRLAPEDAGFLDSRAAALRALRAEGAYDYVLPLQEDFILDRRPDWSAIDQAVLPFLQKGNYASVRLMPCPGPQKKQSEMAAWWELDAAADTYGFTFQATVWRLDACADFYTAMCKRLEQVVPRATTPPTHRIDVEVRANFAENDEGQQFFWKFFEERGQKHLAWRRAGPWANAVYLCPWPYRPTAIVRGRLEDWARDLARREGVPL